MAARAPIAHCLEPLHADARIRAWGTFSSEVGRYRRYRCEPPFGDPHYFSVGIEGNRRRRSAGGHPPCPSHAGARVVRAGTYRRPPARPRQRYLCDHRGHCSDACGPDCPGTHRFTPALPRDHVHSGDRCAECLELRGYHRGELAVARRHRFPARVVAAALSSMSLGISYARAGREALEMLKIPLDQPRRAASATPPRRRRRWSSRPARKRAPASRQAGRFWHIGAGFVEAFAPVVWADVEPRLRERAAANRAIGPVAWQLDEIPIYALDAQGRQRKTDGWSVLLLAEADWSDPLIPGATKLRLVRGMPKATSACWRLLFDEVGERPDIILSDAGTPIIAAVRRHWPTATPLLVPSTWHLRQALEANALKRAVKAKDTAARQLRTHLGGLGRDGIAMSSVDAWHAWWDELERLAAATSVVRMGDLNLSRRNYEARMAEALPLLLAEPRLRQSTGGLESLIRSLVEPILAGRAQQFGNIERTNNLFDLVVCRAEGAFRDLNRVAELIAADELPHGGWTVPLRAIADPLPAVGRNPSLRDERQIRDVAAKKGLV